MKLLSFRYKESSWELCELFPLQALNLLVAKNAAGKTRTIRAIMNVASFLQMKEILMGTRTFDADLVFCLKEDPTKKVTYSISINNGIVEKEILIFGKETLINRIGEEASYRTTKINPPAERLIIQVRRDQELFPEIERLMLWAEGVTCVSMSDINPLTILGMGKLTGPYPFSDLVDSLLPSDKEQVIARSKALGYDIVGLKTIQAVPDLRLVQIKENHVTPKLLDMNLSSGMMRTLYLLCFVSVIKHNSKLSLLLIDDLGEGLDYYRSVALGKIIFDDCKENELQLIASSNDAFVMDVVDLEYWQVLLRDKNIISTINPKNSKELFREFKMTGLSNFDLFSSNFIDNYLSKNKVGE